MKKRILIIVVIAIIAFIWGQSFLSQEDSARESGLIYQFFKPFLEFFVGPGNLTRNMVRKIAHFVEFACLGLALSFLLKNRKRGLFLVLGISFSAAFLDETIQIFSGRGPMIQDVWLDLAGALSAAGVFFLLRFLYLRTKQ